MRGYHLPDESNMNYDVMEGCGVAKLEWLHSKKSFNMKELFYTNMDDILKKPKNIEWILEHADDITLEFLFQEILDVRNCILSEWPDKFYQKIGSWPADTATWVCTHLTEKEHPIRWLNKRSIPIPSNICDLVIEYIGGWVLSENGILELLAAGYKVTIDPICPVKNLGPAVDVIVGYGFWSYEDVAKQHCCPVTMLKAIERGYVPEASHVGFIIYRAIYEEKIEGSRNTDYHTAISGSLALLDMYCGNVYLFLDRLSNQCHETAKLVWNVSNPLQRTLLRLAASNSKHSSISDIFDKYFEYITNGSPVRFVQYF
jgi:hypothetical protein